MIFSIKTKRCLVWMILICIFTFITSPVFCYAETTLHKLVIGEIIYELDCEPYENYMGLVVNAEELMHAFGFEYEFDEELKFFEIFYEDTSVMLMHEATHYYKNDESITNNKCGPNASWEFDSDTGVLTISGTGEMYNYHDLPSPWYQSSVAHLVVEEGITSIGANSFSYLSNLRSAELPQSLKKIGVCAFSDCNRLTSVSIPDGVRIIEDGAFVFCNSLETVFLPKTLLSIGDQAFDECCNLMDVFYGGSEDDWNALFIDDRNDDLTNADIVCTDGAKHLFKTGSHGLIINGENRTSEAIPVWLNGKVFAPVRPVADSVGATAEWDGNLKKLTILKDGVSISYANDGVNIANVDGRVYVSVDDVWCDFFGPGYEWMIWRSDHGKWCIGAKTLNEVEENLTVTVDKAKGRAGQIISVPVYIENNPGIAGLQLKLSYDEKLKLMGINWTNTLSNLEFTAPGDYTANPLTLIWDGISADDSNGKILTLMLSTDEYTEEGFYPISIDPVENGVYGNNLENVECNVINGGITIRNYIPGDINGDGVVGTKDVTVLRRYIAGGYDVTVVGEALDANQPVKRILRMKMVKQ